ncbi:M48 family metalloprotease [Oceanibium sediminis]|uniref:M48 family metalloprotease n=1 Tax=Oceanibium sediminis TaxID=2026339 RepID=UPI000DD4B180|nr:M48 family metalloprotease [Oceanibium sediminis]
MLKLTPILLAIATAVGMYLLSAWRLGKQLDRQSTELADPRLKALTDQLARALDLPRIKVHIYEIAPVNGLAAPDGRIFITRGFYDKYRTGEVSAEEITSVIAHELGHVALGHSRRRMVDFSGQNAIRVVLGTLFNRILPGIGGYIAGALVSLLAARLSRQDEYEADAYAAALLTRAGIGTAPQISLFQKLEAMTGGRGGQLAWMMSHPKTDERIAAIRGLESRWSAPEGD